MADITMCKSDSCKKKEKCYRFTAPACQYGQSYFVTPPVDKGGNCEYYWPVKNRRKK